MTGSSYTERRVALQALWSPINRLVHGQDVAGELREVKGVTPRFLDGTPSIW